jgi:hypothetical protein
VLIFTKFCFSQANRSHRKIRRMPGFHVGLFSFGRFFPSLLSFRDGCAGSPSVVSDPVRDARAMRFCSSPGLCIRDARPGISHWPSPTACGTRHKRGLRAPHRGEEFIRSSRCREKVFIIAASGTREFRYASEARKLRVCIQRLLVLGIEGVHVAEGSLPSVSAAILPVDCPSWPCSRKQRLDIRGKR